VRLDPEPGEALRFQSANGFSPLVVEHDCSLSSGATASLKQALLAAPGGGTIDRAGLKPFPVRIQALGEEDKPLSRVRISVYGVGSASEGMTDRNGQVELSLYGFQPGQAQAVLAKPAKDYWDLVFRQVELRSDRPNIIRLRSFRETVPHEGARGFLGWGHKLMMQDQLQSSLDGQGVKIAIIDSGCDNTHPALQHITFGAEVTDGGQSLGWTLDPLGHGTHCAGILAARTDRDCPVRGFAPAAEVHIFKIVPGGRFSDLIAALDQCIERDMDIVNLGVGADEISLLVEQKIHEAKQRGIACIAAAGDVGGAVQYPASSPHALAVSAIGRQSEFPMESTHALTLTPIRMVDGTFSPNFTCRGPEIAVCAPGVAVISTVPGGGLDAMDGTSMAAAHVTGLAAILLTNHPVLKSGLGKDRSASRVDCLFDLIRQHCAVLPFGSERAGAGLPTLAAYNAPIVSMFSGVRMPTISAGPLGGQPNLWLIQPACPTPTNYQGQLGVFGGGRPGLQ
jgi:subtilisin